MGRFQAVLKVARRDVGKIAKKLTNAIAKSRKLAAVRVRISQTYNLKMTQYIHQMRKLEYEKRKLKKLLSVAGEAGRSIQLGRELIVGRKADSLAKRSGETSMLRKIQGLRLRVKGTVWICEERCTDLCEENDHSR